MSAATDLMTDPAATDAAAATPVVFDPHVRGESLYDRVTSGLIASVTGAGLIFAWLSLIWITQQAYASRVTAPIEIIEVSGGGGDPNGELGSTERTDIAGADAADQASNSDAEAADYEEPSVMETPEATIDEVAADTQDAMDEGFDFDVPVMNGGVVATGKRASKLGKGLPGLGTGGGGDGGVRREDRWSVIYPPGQTLDEYAKQLDFMKVELGTTVGNVLTIGSNFSSSPTRRIGNPAGEGRLYFMWMGGARKGNDMELLKRAGISVAAAAPVFQFYPKDVEDTLIQLEVRYRNRQPGEIRSTKFAVVPAGGKYGFKVLSQEPLR